MRSAEFRIKDYEKVRFTAGSADTTQLKSCYFTIAAHLESLTDSTQRNIDQLGYNIRQTIYSESNKTIYKERFLSDIDIPRSFIKTKLGYCLFEFTLFVKEDKTTKEIKESIGVLADKIYSKVIAPNNTFNFYKKLKHRNK